MDNARNDDRERRHYPRFKAREGTLAINHTILGPVLNISMGGMIFEYYGSDLEAEEPITMGFYCIDSEFLLTGIMSRTIRDHVVNNHQGILPIIRKQRAIEFTELSSSQHMLLKRYINLNTCGPA